MNRVVKTIVRLIRQPIRRRTLRAQILRRGEIDLLPRIRAHEFVAGFLERCRALNATSILTSEAKDHDGEEIQNTPKLIWTYWGQGFDRAPPIVAACRQRLRLLNPDFKIVELDDTRLEDHVSIPPYIVAKLADNKTHFSDVLRCALLAKHGGIWADATCYCAQPLKVLFERTRRNFFAYTRTDIYLLSSWFMISPPRHLVPAMLRDALFDYWTTTDHLEHYFWIHYLFEALYNLHPPFRAAWDARWVEDSMAAHTLQGCLSLPYDSGRIQEIMEATPIQKLTYKLVIPEDHSYWHWICADSRDRVADADK